MFGDLHAISRVDVAANAGPPGSDFPLTLIQAGTAGGATSEVAPVLE